jgi:hypothetical protein
MFIKEGKLKDQMSISRYYEMTLEQRWEQIFASEYNSSEGNSVVVDAVVRRETVAVAGREAAPDKRNSFILLCPHLKHQNSTLYSTQAHCK